MSTREERCTSCDGTGDLVRADGEWIGYCVCEDGEALKAQQNFDSMREKFRLSESKLNRVAEVLAEVIVASGIEIGDCSLEPGPDLIALAVDLKERYTGSPPWANLGDLIALHTEQLRDNEYAYFELAYTRRTGWMAWVCSHFHQDNPNREVIASGQADTPEGACAAAMREYRATHPQLGEQK